MARNFGFAVAGVKFFIISGFLALFPGFDFVQNVFGRVEPGCTMLFIFLPMGFVPYGAFRNKTIGWIVSLIVIFNPFAGFLVIQVITATTAAALIIIYKAAFSFTGNKLLLAAFLALLVSYPVAVTFVISIVTFLRQVAISGPLLILTFQSKLIV